MMCFETAMLGCQRATIPGASTAETATSPSVQDPTPEAQGDIVPTQVSQVSISPKGWKVYTPPEGDFSIMVQDDLVKINRTERTFFKLSRYEFAWGDVSVYSDKTGKWAENTVDGMRQDTEFVVQGTLRDVTLPVMPGVEYRTGSPDGEIVYREFCEPDCSRSFTLAVWKGKYGLSADEVVAILDSFKLLR